MKRYFVNARVGKPRHRSIAVCYVEPTPAALLLVTSAPYRGGLHWTVFATYDPAYAKEQLHSRCDQDEQTARARADEVALRWIRDGFDEISDPDK